MKPTETFPSAQLHLPPSPITVSIDLETLVQNFHHIRQWVPQPTRILAIIKADAYGHGAIHVAHALESQGLFGFGVASLCEGITLRESGIRCPIIVMGPLLPHHLDAVIHHQLTPVISHAENFHRLVDLLPNNRQPYPIHLKVDTGLHRLGLDPKEALSLIASITSSSTHVMIQGLLTHFADADNTDTTLTNQQIHAFTQFIQQLEKLDMHIPILHMANSAGILFHPTAHLGMVRPGLMLYGYAPHFKNQPPSIQLHPVMQATTYVAHLRSLQPGEVVGYNALFRTSRPSRIAVLPVGYTHGFPRHLTGVGHVLIQGARAPIIGKICMDMMMVDVTEIPHPTMGEEVVLLGRQGELEITAEHYADWLQTIPYEVLCGIGGKAQKTYITQSSTTSPASSVHEVENPAQSKPKSTSRKSG